MYHKPIKVWATLATLLCCNIGVQAATDDPREWFASAIRAMRDVSYEGTLICRHGDKTQTIRLAHRSGENGPVEHLMALDGPAREVTQDNDKLTYRAEDNHTLVADAHASLNPLDQFATADFDALLATYQFKLGRAERLLERQVRVVLVEPKDQWRFGYRLWIDDASKLVIKSELLDSAGKVQEQFSFTNLVVYANDIAPKAATKSLAPAGARTPVVAAEGESWKFNDLPMGFTLKSHQTLPAAADQSATEQWIFSDGLASVSVFIEKELQPDDAFQGMSGNAALTAFGKIENGHQVTVVGEVPEATVRLIGNGVKAKATGTAVRP